MIKALKKIRHNGQLFLAGDIISDISAKEEKRLINKGVAEKIDAVVSDDQTASSTDSESTSSIGIGIEETIQDTLDLNFNTNELKDGAKEQGLSFKANISKKDLIDLIVSNNAENYFLDQLDD